MVGFTWPLPEGADHQGQAEGDAGGVRLLLLVPFDGQAFTTATALCHSVALMLILLCTSPYDSPSVTIHTGRLSRAD